MTMSNLLDKIRPSPRTSVAIVTVLTLVTVLHLSFLDKTLFGAYNFGGAVFKPVQSVNTDNRAFVRPLNKGNKIPRVLFWPFINAKLPSEVWENSFKVCDVKCDVTFNTSEIENSKAVVYILDQLWTENWVIGTKKTIKFPTYRRPDQVWVLSNLEPPPNLFGNMEVFNGLFNWTMWYRTDSTIYSPYGGYVEKTQQQIADDKEMLDSRNIFREKEKGIMAMISNCKDTSRRYRFVKELSKHIDIDLYGGCYDNFCGDPDDFATCEPIMKKYKFYLSLENSICTDYVTEKYWATLQRDQIPIVNWNLQTVSKSIPIPGSYISVHDFNSVQELAEYIKKVGSNETLYNSYFQWQKKFVYGFEIPGGTWCKLCHKLHSDYEPQVYDDIDGWVKNDACEKVNKLNNIKTVVDEFLFWKVGI